jgi:hypothetical protein
MLPPPNEPPMQQIAKNKARNFPNLGKPNSPKPVDKYLTAPPETVPSG